MKNLLKFTVLVASLFLVFSCTKNSSVKLSYEKYVLGNGLEVVLHQDLSDPIVAVAIQYHVGSGREKPGKTGFAHFFEHMLFQRSENLPRNAFFQKIARMGGSFNGSTNTDGTNYYETVPRDALEKVLWMESDRMGYFINTVTQGGLEREIDIVSNEKRQNYDSQPYGQSSIMVAKELFPAGHPYSWTTIGEIADLRGATLEDVKEFYKRFYVPNNATLVIAGDFDVALVKELVNKYFGEIPKGADVEKPVVSNPVVPVTKHVMWEDAYAKLPQLTLTFPTVEQYNPDSYALQAFTTLFAGGKKSPLYKVLVEEKRLAPNVNAMNMSREVAGSAAISVRAFEDVNLNFVYGAIQEAFAKFEKDGVDATELEKFKVMQEVNLYNRMSSINGKAIMMARDNEFGGSPDLSLKELEKYRAVTAEAILAVYEKYFKDKSHLALSVVPAGKADLAVNYSRMADIVMEKVEDQQMKSSGGKITDDSYEKSQSAFDRSVEPGYLPNTPEFNVPQVWKSSLSNGMAIYGITQKELPVVQFTINIRGGMMMDPPGKGGLSYLNARLMNEGTALRSAEELESAMGLLGARISVSSDVEGVNVNVTALTRNFTKVIELTEEILLNPRFDEDALARVKQETKSLIKQSSADPAAVARRTRDILLYGADGTLSRSVYGTAQSIDSITIDDIKDFYKLAFSPSVSTMNIAGSIDKLTCESALATLAKNWKTTELTIPEPVQGTPAKAGQIYFVDNPGSPQSMIIVGKRGLSFNDPDFYPATVVNYRLGAGSQGMLFDVLRLQRGFTYGASSSFEAGKYYNNFSASSSVQASTTPEAVKIFRELIGGYGNTFNDELLSQTKNSMTKAMASSFETLGSLVKMLSNISYYNLPEDYVKQHEQILNNMTLEEAKAAISRNLNINEMVIVVVGDARTQLKLIEAAGLGKPILVSR
ncbi:MAG: M16 family metallopeptidase [Bacteroidales bacterium]